MAEAAASGVAGVPATGRCRNEPVDVHVDVDSGVGGAAARR